MRANPYSPPKASLGGLAEAPQTEGRPRIFGLGSISIAGLLGGPLAAAWLAVANAKAMALQVQTRVVVLFFAMATAAWVYILLSVPSDAISQLIPHVPQVFLWWLFCFVVFRRTHLEHKSAGGAFRSVWAAIGIALVASVGVRVLNYLVGLAAS